MSTAGIKLLGLLVAGTGLGAVLGSLVDPVPRQPERPTALLSARPEVAGSASYQFVEMGPEDLSPPSLPDGYAPDWATEDDQGVWQYPEPTFAAWKPEPFPSRSELDAQLAEDAALLDTVAEHARTAASEPAPPLAEAAPATEPRLAALY